VERPIESEFLRCWVRKKIRNSFGCDAVQEAVSGGKSKKDGEKP
jgi:hypothetical protein